MDDLSDEILDIPLLSDSISKASEINTGLDTSPDYDELCSLIETVFNHFDMESKHRIDARDVSTVLRCLGLIPTEADILDMLNEIEDETGEGYILYNRFFPALIKRLNERSFFPLNFEELLQVFKILDEEGKGYLTKEQLANYLTESGEPLDEFELDDAIVTAADRETGKVDYNDYIVWLLADDTVGERVRTIVDNHLEIIRLAREEAERIAAELAADAEEDEASVS